MNKYLVILTLFKLGPLKNQVYCLVEAKSDEAIEEMIAIIGYSVKSMYFKLDNNWVFPEGYEKALRENANIYF